MATIFLSLKRVWQLAEKERQSWQVDTSVKNIMDHMALNWTGEHIIRCPGVKTPKVCADKVVHPVYDNVYRHVLWRPCMLHEHLGTWIPAVEEGDQQR